MHQDLNAPTLARAPRVLGEFFGLLADARRTLDEDPRRARAYLDRIAALFAEAGAEGQADRALLPEMPAGSGSRAAKGGLAGWQLKRVIDHIDRALGGSIVVETLAELTKLSSGHFCRAFKVSVGETPHAFLVRQRIRRAQRMMLHSDETLSQIACACGLTDQAHLTRLFRKLVGDTPLAWRRTWRVPA